MNLNVRAVALNISTRFAAMSLRERGLVAAALLAVLIVAWDTFLMQPLDRRRRALNQEMQTLQESISDLASNLSGEKGNDPFTSALSQQQALQQSLAAVDTQLQAVAADLIPPQRMVGALRELLDHQHSLRLISLRNLPSYSLAPAEANSSNVNQNAAVAESGPFVHPIEMVIEGDYLSVLNYLRSVEQLKWRFYWHSMDLNSTDYPKNRIRIQLNSLSMDKEWLGV